MARLFDRRIISRAELTAMSASFIPTGSGNPTTWSVKLSFTFMTYESNGSSLGMFKSSMAEGDEIPYYALIKNATAKPTSLEILSEIFRQEKEIVAFVLQQILKLTNEEIDLNV